MRLNLAFHHLPNTNPGILPRECSSVNPSWQQNTSKKRFRKGSEQSFLSRASEGGFAGGACVIERRSSLWTVFRSIQAFGGGCALSMSNSAVFRGSLLMCHGRRSTIFREGAI